MLLGVGRDEIATSALGSLGAPDGRVEARGGSRFVPTSKKLVYEMLLFQIF